MTDFTEVVRSVLFGIINAEFDKIVFITDANSTAPTPPMPYISVNTLSKNRQNGFGWVKKETIDNDPEEDFEKDILETLHREDELTFSMNTHSDNSDEALTIAEYLHDCLEWIAIEEMYDEGYSYVDIGPIQNRTLYMVDDYEHRYGFDVVYRINSTIERRKDTIEEAEINGITYEL